MSNINETFIDLTKYQAEFEQKVLVALAMI